jgi:hypothetical protein
LLYRQFVVEVVTYSLGRERMREERRGEEMKRAQVCRNGEHECGTSWGLQYFHYMKEMEL